MRKLSATLAIAAGAAAVAWLAHPPFREWPGVSHVAAAAQAALRSSGIIASAAPSKGRDEAGQAAAGGQGPAEKGGGRGGGVVPVAAVTAVAADMPVVISAPGTVDAIATVQVKPRVDGQISEILFKEGDLVKAGQTLFKLDARLMNAQIRQAEANVSRDKAALKDAELILSRRESLVSKRIVSEASTDTQRSTVESLRASIAAGEALLEAQRTQLDYLTIRAPITGRTGAVRVELGVNVRANSDTITLVTINQTQPIAVVFAVTQGELPALRRAFSTGVKSTVRALGPDPAGATGSLTFIDNQVDKQTGTLLAKVEIPNDGEAFWPGQSVDVSMTVEKRSGYVAVPTSAVLPSQQGMISWVIGAENKVQAKPVTLDRVVGDTAYVAKGLAPGDRVVTDGQVRLAPGVRVSIRGQNPSGEAAPPPTSKPDSRSSIEDDPARSGIREAGGQRRS